jgi:hypothetical protein
VLDDFFVHLRRYYFARFQAPAGLRRTPFFRFTLMVIREDKDPAFRPASTTWSALKGPVLVSLPRSNPTQLLINRRPAEAGVVFEGNVVLDKSKGISSNLARTSVSS